MISIIMPYWNRIELARKALTSFEECYFGESGIALSLEVVICDDGSMIEPFELDREYKFPVNVISLPKKKHALNPCRPINLAAREAKGEVLLITNPEVIHIKPILHEMLDCLWKTGPKTYVAAAAWSVDKKKWRCHSTFKPSGFPIPKGAGFHFCAMIMKDFFFKIEGFSEEYRSGQAFDDTDFLWKLYEAGANFKILDDCVVHHHETTTNWPKGGWERNRKLFVERWEHVL